MMVRRDTAVKRSVPIDRIAGEVLDCMGTILADMYTVASQKFDSRIFDCETLDEALEFEAQGILRVCWCQDPDCGHEIEDVTGLRMLGIPVGSAGSEASTPGRCVVCGRDGVATLMARTY
jgi:prolyl-tRNA synthetase